MYKFKVTLQRITDLGDNIKGISKIYFMVKQKALYSQILTLFSGWKNKVKEENKTIFIESGTKKYVDKEKDKWEEFMFGDKKKLNKMEKYKQINSAMNDRGVKNIVTKIREVPKKIKDKIGVRSINKALLDDNVLSFFAKMGIIFTWKIEKFK